MTETRRCGNVLIANRGEIACRLIRGVHRKGMKAIAVYGTPGENSDQAVDALAEHVRLADAVAPVEGGASAYTNLDGLLEAALKHDVYAVMPGYGFISESPEAADAFERLGVTWVGPRGDTIRKFGLKHEARKISEESNVPVPPGTGVLNSVDEAVEAANRIEYPVLIKCTSGGGGMGQSIAYEENEVMKGFESAAETGAKLFDDDRVYVEKYVERAKHIEVQIFGDGKGSAVALGERECSLQRRRQKVVEESPSPFVRPKLRQRICNAAVQLASKAKYRSAGTIEFLVDADKERFYFLEANTRLQVEHGVSELVTGVDLVGWMLDLCANRPLEGWEKFRQALEECDNSVGVDASDVFNGHAIQVRVYAEDVLHDFRPSPGTITCAEWPKEAVLFATPETLKEKGENVCNDARLRLDTWVRPGAEISSKFDAMIGKMIAKADKRQDAIDAMVKGLSKTEIFGVITNLSFGMQAISLNRFIDGSYSTGLLESVHRSFQYQGCEVIKAGISTTLQDYPGRTPGYWPIGISSSGPVDSYAFRMANALVGNELGAVALEMTTRGACLKFHTDIQAALTGAELDAEADERPVPWWTSFTLRKGSTLNLGGAVGGGKCAYLAISGGFVAPTYLGSASTFPLVGFGGTTGKPLRAGDWLSFRKDACGANAKRENLNTLPGWLRPAYPQNGNEWVVGAINGPHGTSEFLSEKSLQGRWKEAYTVSNSANRLGTRLEASAPSFSREDGGQAGLHPSNIHDMSYVVGAVNYSGDTPIVLGVDGPSLGGFICPMVVASAEMWKVSQAKPKDSIRFRALSADDAIAIAKNAEEACKLVRDGDEVQLEALHERWHPNIKLGHNCEDAVLSDFKANRSDPVRVLCRMSGEWHVLVEYEGDPMSFKPRFRVEALIKKLEQKEEINELCPGACTLLVGFDTSKIGWREVIQMIRRSEEKITSVESMSVSSRIVHLPFAFDDKQIQASLQNYMRTVRQKAPYLPRNIDFVKRINGLQSDQELLRMLSAAEYVVIGLGDVYLGSPVCIASDPTLRCVTSKFNPARTSTPVGAVGLGGAYLCVYAAQSPGGYQLCGRTLPIWDQHCLIPSTSRGTDNQWLFKQFDRIRFYPVSSQELDATIDQFLCGNYPIKFEEGKFSLKEHMDFLEKKSVSISKFRSKQLKAFDEERKQWVNEMSSLTAKNDDAQSEGETEPETPPFGVGIRSDLAATVRRINVKEGDDIAYGATIAVLESMKVEMEISAPFSGRVHSINVKTSALVEPEQLICFLVKPKKEAFGDMSIQHLREMYRKGVLTPTLVAEEVIDRVHKSKGTNIWTSTLEDETIRATAKALACLKKSDFLNKPLFGIPVAVKGNIDVAGLFTDAACPPYGYTPKKSARCVEMLVDAGALVIGSTNLDQFATGLVGTRSPRYGTPKNPFNEEYIPGGSSSGSAVAVSMQIVSAALGTDTAGSGRVPAGFNDVVGLKPSRGVISCSGAIPACQSLDCISVFAKDTDGATRVFQAMEGVDREDEFSRERGVPLFEESSLVGDRFTFGVPEESDLEFFGDEEARRIFATGIDSLTGVGGQRTNVDYGPMRRAAELLYNGPFVAERYASVGEFLEGHPPGKDREVDEDVHKVVTSAKHLKASDLFRAQAELRRLNRRAAEHCWSRNDVLVVPTVPTVFKVADVNKDPSLNSKLGHYTNFVNLMDLCALAIPLTRRSDNGVPMGMTLIAPAFKEGILLSLAQRLGA